MFNTSQASGVPLEGAVATDDPSALKARFQSEWNLESRVVNYVAAVALKEFADGPGRDAWRSALQAILPKERKLRVLDVGCGPGIFAQLYAELGHEVVALDFSQRMLASARGLMSQRSLSCRFELGDAEEPPFAPQSFDVVSSRHLLFNLPRPDRAMASWRELLVPGGQVIAMGEDVPAGADWRRSALQWIERASGHREPRPAWTPSPEYLGLVRGLPLAHQAPSARVKAMLEQAGFSGLTSADSAEIRRARKQMLSFPRRWLQPAGTPYLVVGLRGQGT